MQNTRRRATITALMIAALTGGLGIAGAEQSRAADACVWASVQPPGTSPVTVATGTDCPPLPPASSSDCPPGLVREYREITVSPVATAEVLVCVWDL